MHFFKLNLKLLLTIQFNYILTFAGGDEMLLFRPMCGARDIQIGAFRLSRLYVEFIYSFWIIFLHKISKYIHFENYPVRLLNILWKLPRLEQVKIQFRSIILKFFAKCPKKIQFIVPFETEPFKLCFQKINLVKILLMDWNV